MALFLRLIITVTDAFIMEQQMSIFGPTVGHVFMTLDTYPAACAIDTELAGSAA